MPSSTHNNRNRRNQNPQGQGGLPQWRVVRRTATRILDDETFQHFGDAWAYAQPDPDNGIHHYIHREQVLQEFQRGARYLTTAYEGNVRIDLVRGGCSIPLNTLASRIVT